MPDTLRAVALALCTLALGCAAGEELDIAVPDSDHEEASDLVPYANEKFDGALAAFDPDLIVDDLLFENHDAVTVAAMQDLLESSPYGTRSFLADEMVGGRRFSEVLVDVAQSRRINPVLLLVRMQVEKSLVSKTVRPSGNAIDFALGCGCPDGRGCSAAFRGLDKQLACGADTMRQHFDASIAATGQWRKGSKRRSLDGRMVTPGSHATASLYAYTPWVLEGSGGNWLVWNVGRKYIGAMLDRGTYDADELPPPEDENDDETPGSCADRCGSTSAVPVGDGSACFCDDTCIAEGDCCDDFAAQCGAPDEDADTGEDSGESSGSEGEAPSDDTGCSDQATAC